MTHLAFYREHGISPVRYAGTREEHFERRAALYRSLRLPPLAFRGSKVLEVAAGTGQNAEYLASLGTAHLELVEPHPLGWSAPNLKEVELAGYEAPFPFDIVICENWIGLPERHLIQKLAEMVVPKGVLVLTCIHPQGVYPNMLRRRIAKRLVTDEMGFEEKTVLLVKAFGPHLATMQDMTRSHRDWVQDMMLNPAVDKIGLSFPALIEALPEFDVLGTNPEFSADWRWFKSLVGNKRGFNEHALTEYYRHSSRFRNYRDEDWAPALEEAERLLELPAITWDEVAEMGPFKSLFGRETIHASFQRR